MGERHKKGEVSMKTKMNLENRFALLQPDWVQLSPFGDFAHARGVQRVDRTAAEMMVRNFQSFSGRAGRLFGGVPFYVGHPDMPGSSESADKKAYGWITRLETRADGLHGFVKWSEPGEELLRNGHFKFFSPYWEAEEIGTEGSQRVYRPVLLISVGLTNQPNIPVNPLANESGKILKVEFTGGSVEGQSVPISLQPEAAAQGLSAEARLALSNALSSGRILPREREQWRERLQNDLPGTQRELKQLRPVLHVRSCTEDVRLRRDECALLENRRTQRAEAVQRKMQQGLSYDEAWQQVKSEKPQLFESAV
jgi:phage I-like protein